MAVADQIQPKDHVVVGIDLGDVRRIRLLRQIVEQAGHPVAHVVRGRVDVSADIELDVDARAPVLADRFNRPDRLDTGDAILDHLGDPGLDHVCGGARIDRVDGHDGRIDVRILAQRQALEGNQPERKQQ